MAGSGDDLKSLVKSLQFVQCSTCSSGDKVFDRMLVTRARNKKSSCIAIRGQGSLSLIHALIPMARTVVALVLTGI